MSAFAFFTSFIDFQNCPQSSKKEHASKQIVDDTFIVSYEFESKYALLHSQKCGRHLKSGPCTFTLCVSRQGLHRLVRDYHLKRDICLLSILKIKKRNKAAYLF